MFHNRISRLADDSNALAAMGQASSRATTRTPHTSHDGSNVMVTWTSLAGWQQQLYRMAYEQALLDTARPRHEHLIAWN